MWLTRTARRDAKEVTKGMKHVVAISRKSVLATATETTVTVDTKITFIVNILNAFKPILQAKESAANAT